MTVLGIVFSIDTISYVAMSFILNCIPDTKKNFLKIILAGIPLFSLGMLLLGPAPLIFPK